MKRTITIIAELAALSLAAAEIDIDGVVWRYTVEDGMATIQGATIPESASHAAKDDSLTLGSTLELLHGGSRGELEIPAKIATNIVKAIAPCAFAGEMRLESAVLPDGIEKIGERAFAGCRNLKSVRIPSSVVEIGSEAFISCRSLAALSLPPNITNIANRAFSDCRMLKEVTLPRHLQNIGAGAFADCAQLRTLTFPQGVASIAHAAFADCDSLETAIFLGPQPETAKDAFARIGENCLFRASSAAGWDVPIPGVWQGRKIADLAIESYRRTTLIYLPSIVGALGTLAVLVLALILRERRSAQDADDF